MNNGAERLGWGLIRLVTVMWVVAICLWIAAHCLVRVSELESEEKMGKSRIGPGVQRGDWNE